MIMVAVVSKDGFLTTSSDPNPASWTSQEDKDFFSSIRAKHSLFVMGKNTYLANIVKPTPGTLKVVLTKRPADFDDYAVPGQLEFHNLSAKQFVTNYENSYDSCLVLGGSYVYEEFLKTGLISEIYLTIEPVVHKSGVPLLASRKVLQEIPDLPKPIVKVLNKRGTKLLHYSLS